MNNTPYIPHLQSQNFNQELLYRIDKKVDLIAKELNKNKAERTKSSAFLGSVFGTISAGICICLLKFFDFFPR